VSVEIERTRYDGPQGNDYREGETGARASH
jgi:hypothetical protein